MGRGNERVSTTFSPQLPPLEVYLLGLVDFEDVQQFQRRLVYEQGASLLLCEHPPTISVGRAGSRAHIVPDDESLRGLGIRMHWVNRGGGCILHLPGQLAAYVVMPLEQLGLSLNDYVARLHTAVCGVLNEFELRGTTVPGVGGVFLGQARVATVAVAVNRWIAYHGVTLNVGSHLAPFDLIDEPGLGGMLSLRQTSMEARRQRPAPMARVREAMIRHVETTFGLERHHLYTQHPLVRRKARAHVYVESHG